MDGVFQKKCNFANKTINAMKNNILLLVFVFVSNLIIAQAPVRFLGIPVDGTKAEMIEQIRQKGFTYHPISGTEYLEGEFNGQTVHVYVHTNKSKVDRIMVAYQHMCTEAQIITEFNGSLHDFENSEKYLPTFQYINEHIDRNEDISYEMTVNNKEYSAYFHQTMSKEDVDELKAEISDNFEAVCALLKSNLENFTAEELEENKDLFSFIDNDTISKEEKVNNIAAMYYMSLVTSNHVWFKIAEYYGQYYIVLFYDNEKNRPNGEDL